MEFKQRSGGGASPELLVYTLKVINVPKKGQSDSGVVEMTGWNKGAVIGDTLEAVLTKYKIKEIKRRNHNGVFDNPDDAIDSFFEANCTYDYDPPVEEQLQPEQSKQEQQP